MTSVHIDGAARGNPGPAAYALTLARPGGPTVEEARTMGKATNNVAEYSALVRALEVALDLGVKELAVFSDSELMVKQMAGEYRVKSTDLQRLYQEACGLRKQFDKVTITHVRRAENKRADFLCNEALDGRPVGVGDVPAAAKSPVVATLRGGSRAPDGLEAEVVALLNAVRMRWARGDEEPAAVEVWDRIWRIVSEPRGGGGEA